jgi:hypothetical protein
MATQAPDIKPGETAKQYQDRLDVDKARKKKVQDFMLAAEDERRRAQAEAMKFDNLSRDFLAEYDKSNFVGPIKGNLGLLASSLGVTVDQTAQKIEKDMQTWANDYIESISGATVPVAEFEKRFKPLLPNINMDREQFRTRLESLKRMLSRNREAIAARYGIGDTSVDLDLELGDGISIKSQSAPNPKKQSSGPSTNSRGRPVLSPDDL